MLERFLNHIHENQLFRKEHRILLAVSGGLDSTVMAHLFHQAKFNAGIAHCNFGLRGEASDGDEAFVQGLANDLSMPYHVTRFATEEVAAARGVSIQMAARDLRNEWFEELVREDHYDFIATAHHLNDALETVLLNLARGTGIDGLAGIPLRQRRFVRPMLFASRAQLETFARSASLQWREDASNATDDYQRNVIRHKVIPVLREINPNLDETIADTLVRIRGARRFARTHLRDFSVRNMYYDGTHVHIRVADLLEDPYAPVILWELLKDLGFNFDQCRDMAQRRQPGAVFLSASHQVTVGRGELIIGVPPGEKDDHTEIQEGARTAHLAGQTLTLEVRVLGGDVPTDPSMAIMDLDKVGFPLLWRRWREGDRFVPLGMSQHKKVSDFLVDEKVSRAAKHDVTVVESGGEIVWIAGLRISDKVKVTEHTRRVLVLHLQTAAKGLQN
ncbi:MAG: tRNA lysidine(34) synthetase TilS [Cyclobacteriaceae bacterium]|nr:tRNA lysidine(34) synthetase TilS [Cyclobacteriaceae bacterium]